MKVSVLLADDNKLFRELLAYRLSETNDLEVIGEAEDQAEVLAQVKDTRPDIVMMDICQPRLKGIETTQQILSDHPICKIIALTSHSEKLHIKGALTAGVHGYFLKNCTFEHLLNGIRQINEGKKAVGTDVESIIIDEYLGRSTNISATLTKRETQILGLLAEGKSVREISDSFFISIKTVGTHKQNIFDKMGFDNLAQLVKYAIKQGIVY
jgi:two-component system, NarL family, response regulator NreC